MWTKLTLVVIIFTVLLVNNKVTNDLVIKEDKELTQLSHVPVKRHKNNETDKELVYNSLINITFPNYTAKENFLQKLSPKRRIRCVRYAQQYYGGAPFYPTIQFNQQYPNYLIIPSKCYNYCQHCPTSTCRRRCPIIPPVAPPKGHVDAEIIISPKNATTTCNCDPNGSKYSSCDPTTGNCICKNHYEGRTCDKCKDGYWKNLKKDCIKCHCNEFGSRDSICNQETGQCNCNPGITGQNCDKCRNNFYGTVETGCIECEPCTKKGHVCGKGGKCVCPDLTVGSECDRCAQFAWGYEPSLGCKACNCSHAGSSFPQCDQIRGSCFCKTGYEGEKCERCSFGYYGYPNCRRCLCNSMGTLESLCRNDLCQCNNDGSCNCKENVMGSKCNTCKNGTFGLSKENYKGCTECFCFGRSNTCVDTGYNWDKIRFEKEFKDDDDATFDVIRLRKEFTGDLTTSYNGYFSVNSTGGSFTIFITGNGISLQSEVSTTELRVNEKYWKITSGIISSDCQIILDRKCFLLVLQNVTSVIIQGKNMHIVEVLLDSAKPYIPYNRTSHSIEKCECPPEYTGLSCQNPNKGYYRYFPKSDEITQIPWIDTVIGVAKPCDCNGRSNECDPSTGYCINCSDNTKGFHCEFCATGYYNDSRKCVPCLCPSEYENNADSCIPEKHGFVCRCKEGYTGSRCDHCAPNYYRSLDPYKCTRCNCNPFGSAFDNCDSLGKCTCKPGFIGNKCNQCTNPREYIKNGLCSPCDECTQLLFDDIEKLNEMIEETLKLFKEGLHPPWKLLDNLRKRYNTLTGEFYYDYEKANRILKNYNITTMKDQLYKIEYKVNRLDNVNEDNFEKIQKNQNATRSIENELKKLRKRLKNVITELQEFGKKQVDVEESLNKAIVMLEEMNRNIALFDNEENYSKKIFAFCDKISNNVNYFFIKPRKLPHELLKKLQEKIADIELITKGIESRIASAKYQNDKNFEQLELVKRTIDTLNGIDYEDNIKEITDKITETNKVYRQAEEMYQILKNLNFSNFNHLKKQLTQYDNEIPKLKELVRNANQHAEMLKRRVEELKNILNINKNENTWEKIHADYNSIVKGIKEAKEATEKAKDVLNRALEIINPKDSDKLTDRSNLAHAHSDRLKQRITNFKNTSNKLKKTKDDIEDIIRKLIQYGENNNELIKLLEELEKKVQAINAKELEKAIDNSSAVSKNMRELDQKISNLNLSAKYDLFKKYENYKNLTSKEEMEKLRDTINNTRKNLLKVYKILESNKTASADINKTKPTNLDAITSKLKQLQNSILYAKQVAESVNVAMGLSNCSMHYNMPQTEAFRSMSISFKCKTCQLFKWKSSKTTVNLKIQNGKAVLHLDGEKNIKVNIDNPERNIMERTLFIQRSGSLIQLKFKEDVTWKSAHVGNKLLIIYGVDDIQLGDELSTVAPNTSYIYKFSINDRNIGLWNFGKSSGQCKGIDRANVTETKGIKLYSGTGYKMFTNETNILPAKFNLGFDFATFDENSLMYLAQEKENPCAYISLTLENGFLKMDVHHSNGQTVSLKTSEKYNDGRNHNVELAMYHERPTQYYKLTIDFNMTVTKDQHLDSKAVFRIKKAIHYIGGLTPTFNATCIEVNKGSFLGFLNVKGLNNELLSSGVVETFESDTLKLNKAWFNGNGSVNLIALPTSAKRSNAINSISFILRPLSANAAIIRLDQLGVIALENKFLNVNLKNEGKYLIDQPFEINEYHWVSIEFKDGVINVTVNEKNITLKRTTTAAIQKLGNLEITLGSSMNYNSLYGGISDIHINNEKLLFSFETVINFTNVDIGREVPLPPPKITLKVLKSPVTISMTNSMQNTEACAPTSHYKTDPYGLNFGDRSDSYMHIKTPIWKKNFVISFEFRTFYPNGMLFVSIGSMAQPHYVFLEIKDGLIIFSAKGKRKPSKHWPITFSKKVNDGQWHSIKVMKTNGKKLHLLLDKERTKPVRMPKTVVRNEIFFGWLPEDYTDYKELKEKTHQFRGCLRNLEINEEEKLLQKNKNDIKYSNVRQCFPNIEKGAYFGGDAYAIYRENFKINKLLELSFEFRTGEQNGILVSLSNIGSYPALSVELQNGAIVMTINLGNGIESNVTNNLDSDFALCNNMWHNVSAMYSSSELTVNVDGIRKSWVQSDVNSLMNKIEAPLYVGGLPDNAAVGPLKTKENFKGCIKNLKIADEMKEWPEMEELHNILLNSCPVVGT